MCRDGKINELLPGNWQFPGTSWPGVFTQHPQSKTIKRSLGWGAEISTDQMETLLRYFSKGSVPENKFPGNWGLYSFLLVCDILIRITNMHIHTHMYVCSFMFIYLAFTMCQAHYLGHLVESLPFFYEIDLVIPILQMRPSKVREHLNPGPPASKFLLLAIEQVSFSVFECVRHCVQ